MVLKTDWNEAGSFGSCRSYFLAGERKRERGNYSPPFVESIVKVSSEAKRCGMIRSRFRVQFFQVKYIDRHVKFLKLILGIEKTFVERLRAPHWLEFQAAAGRIFYLPAQDNSADMFQC